MNTRSIACALFLVSSAAVADTITVCTGGSCDYTDIQPAIDAASNGDVIEVATGTYYPSATLDTNGKAITIRGEVGLFGIPSTIIDGDGDKVVLRMQSGEASTTVLENLFLTRGSGTNGGGIESLGSSPSLNNCWFFENVARLGGGMYSRGGSPTFNSCVFLSNIASLIRVLPDGETGRGGGFYGESGEPIHFINCGFGENVAEAEGGGFFLLSNHAIVSDCSFPLNVAWNGGGGAALQDSSPAFTNCSIQENQVSGGPAAGHGGGMQNNASSPTLSGCVFLSNTANDGRGGGMYNFNGSNPSMANCTFESNTTSWLTGSGGGIENDASSPTLTICVIQGNSGGSGGGMMNRNGSNPQLTGCTLVSNGTNGSGGGMYNTASNPMLDSCIFQSNIASFTFPVSNTGGGLYNSPNSVPTITNCVFEGNSADAGGGISCGNLTLDSCTFTSNYCAFGGGINGEVLTLTNCIFVDNHVSGPNQGTGGAVVCSGASGFTGCTFDGNTSYGLGGGVAAISSHALSFDNCTFINNTALDYDGWRPMNGGGILANELGASLKDCTMCDNFGGNINSKFIDLGGNCIAVSCVDTDGDGTPDACQGLPGFDSCAGGPVTLTNNRSLDIAQGGIACAAGGISTENLYARSYDLSAWPMDGLEIEVTCVAYGASNGGSEVPSVVSIYLDTDGGVPQAPGVDLELLGERETIAVAGFSGMQVASFSSPICVPADSVIVVTVSFEASPDGFVSFTGNDTSSSGSTYLLSESCGLSSFVDLADIGFPEYKWVQVLVGNWDCGDYSGCPADFNGDGDVSGADMGLLLAAWGTAAGDLNGDGTTSGADIGLLLAAWGPCLP